MKITLRSQKGKSQKGGLLTISVFLLSLIALNCETPQTVDEPPPATQARSSLSEINQELNSLSIIGFAVNSSSISNQAYESWKKSNMVALKTAAAAFPEGAKLVITGHTDNRGSESHNQNLGKKRAQHIADRLANDGLDINFVVKSAGYSQPISGVPADSPKNRRVSFSITQ